jgi:serine phosphatase RsbU (regulator of sigma subunit)
LQEVLLDPTVLSDEDAAEVRKVIASFKDLFGDSKDSTTPATYFGNTLLRGELMNGFRLNWIAQRVLVLQLSKIADEIVESTQQQLANAGDYAITVRKLAFSASAIGLATSVGLTIVFVIFVIDHNILLRLNDITQKMRALARGETIVVTGADKSDELGEMARALQVFWKAELERREFQYQLELANKELQREVDDSIYVAQRIQNALFRGQLPAGPWLSGQALLSRPCKLLGGDSYWLERFDDGYVVALIDCTGHGVPGAMMTIVTSIYVNAILHQEGLRDPAEILLRLAYHVQNSLLEKSEDVKFDAGFDAAVCYVDLQSQRLCYAGGGIPLIVLDSNSGEIRIVKGDGFGIDSATIGSGPRPVTREVELRSGMRFYLTSDGLVTQPDGPCGVGFGWTRLVKLLRETRDLSLTEQNERVWSSFREFSGNADQRDDVTLVAFAA